jgi:serine/threonine-protein kinase
VVAVETYGRYSLLEPLGAGSITTTFRAKRLGIEGFEKQLVIKRVHPALCADLDFIDAFLAEARKSV